MDKRSLKESTPLLTDALLLALWLAICLLLGVGHWSNLRFAGQLAIRPNNELAQPHSGGVARLGAGAGGKVADRGLSAPACVGDLGLRVASPLQ